VEYIESSGAQCIDTGVTFNSSVYNKLKLEYDMQILSSNGSNAWAVAGTGGQTENIFYVGTQGGVLWYGNGTTDTSTGKPYDYTRQTWILDAYNGVFSVGSLANISYTPNRPSISLNVHLFAYKSVNGYVGHKARLYRAKISNGGVLIRDFVPCISPSVVAGLYDIVNNQFYTNAGSGTFTAGEPTSPLIQFFKQIKAVTIPEGNVVKITDKTSGQVIWEKTSTVVLYTVVIEYSNIPGGDPVTIEYQSENGPEQTTISTNGTLVIQCVAGSKIKAKDYTWEVNQTVGSGNIVASTSIDGRAMIFEFTINSDGKIILTR
jgi:hypothetical protein